MHTSARLALLSMRSPSRVVVEFRFVGWSAWQPVHEGKPLGGCSRMGYGSNNRVANPKEKSDAHSFNL